MSTTVENVDPQRIHLEFLRGAPNSRYLILPRVFQNKKNDQCRASETAIAFRHKTHTKHNTHRECTAHNRSNNIKNAFFLIANEKECR